MSTHATIGKLNSDGSVDFIYCHYDGNPEVMGKILTNYYPTQACADAITALGNLSSLEPRLTPIGLHDFNNQEPGTTVAYHRDRNEELVIYTASDYMEYFIKSSSECDASYAYLWDGNFWNCYDNINNYHIELPQIPYMVIRNMK